MNRRECPGWTADWLTGWLAAVGTTVMVPGMKLSWEGVGNATRAVLHHSNDDPIRALAAQWPDGDQFDALPWPRSSKAENGCDYGTGKLAPQDFARYAEIASRGETLSQWAATAIYTDTKLDRNGRCLSSEWGRINRGRDPHESVRCCLLAVRANPEQRIVRSASGVPERIDSEEYRKSGWVREGKAARLAARGLNNDVRRLNPGRSDCGQAGVDPTAETLSFYAFGILGPVTVRGGKARVAAEHQHDGESRLYIPAWSEPLDRHSIMALLGSWHDLTMDYENGKRMNQSSVSRASALGIHTAWRTVRVTTGSKDNPDIGYNTEPIFFNI